MTRVQIRIPLAIAGSAVNRDDTASLSPSLFEIILSGRRALRTLSTFNVLSVLMSNDYPLSKNFHTKIMVSHPIETTKSILFESFVMYPF